MEDKRATFSTEIRERRWLTPGTFELVLDRPDAFSFVAGQKIELAFAGASREFTVASGPADPEMVLCIRKIEGGRMSALLSRVPTGSELSFQGPYGYFTFKPGGRQAVFVATGTGIAPFVAMTRSHVKNFILLHGVRQSVELYYRAELVAAAARYIPCISSEQELPEGHFAGRVTDFLATELPRAPFDFYLCGSGAMIRDVTHIVDDRFDGSRIFAEKFF
jgi:ferredoxin-NADP reductase